VNRPYVNDVARKTVTQMNSIGVFLALFVACSISAQAPIPNRAWFSASTDIQIGALDGTLSVLPASPPTSGSMATLKCTLQGAGSGPTMSATLPFEYVGGIAELAPGHYLVSGSSAATPPTGYVVRVQVDTSTNQFVTHETVTYAGMDILGVAWEPTAPFLMAIDKAANRLVVGVLQWPPATVTDPVVPASLSTAVTSAGCPALAADHPRVSAVDSATYRIIAERFSDGYIVAVSGGGWVAAPEGPNHANEWIVDVTQSHTGPVLVKSMASSLSGSGAFSLTDVERSVVVATGSVTAVNSWVTLSAPAAFYDYPGYRHRVTGALSADSRDVFPLLRYGQSETGGDVRPGPALILGPSMFVGNPDGSFLVPTIVPGIADGEGLAQPQTFPAYLLLGIGFRYAGAPPDPITGTGSAARLQYTVALSFDHIQKWHGEVAALSVAIPDLAFLSDCVILSQWAFAGPSAPSTLFYSDIAGARVRPAPVTPSSQTQSSGGSANLSASQKRRAFRKSFESNPRFYTPSSQSPGGLWANYLQ
jgi:hypothetical protein